MHRAPTSTSSQSFPSARRISSAVVRALLPFALGAAASLGGCYASSKGNEPPDASLYFPVGLALSQSRDGMGGPRYLFVVNSNFDLRYNSGWVQALDVQKIAAAIHATGCDVDPTLPACASSDVTPFVRASVRIGAFGADVVATPIHSEDGTERGARVGRLLVPVRGDATLTLIDYEESADGNSVTLACAPGARPNQIGGTCASAWRVGGDPNANSRQLSLEGEPFSVAVPGAWPASCAGAPAQCDEPRRSLGIAAIVHQSTGDVSVLVKTQAAPLDAPPTTQLAYTLGGLPAGGTSIVPLDLPETPFTPRFLVTSRTQANVYLLSYFGDHGTLDRGGLFVSDIIPIPTNNGGYDTRGLVVDPPNPGEKRPLRVFLANRTPATLIVGEIDPTTKRLHFYGNEPLPLGPSRVTRAVVPVLLPDGTTALRTRIYVASFDGRFLVSYDPDHHRFGNIVRTGKGPYALAIDTDRKLGFFTNFTESSIQVLDLSPTLASDPTQANPNYEQILFTVGVPTLPPY